MAGTNFAGPVTSTGGFVGNLTGNVTGNVSGSITGAITPTTVVASSSIKGTSLEAEAVGTLTENVASAAVGSLTLDPAYTGAFTVAIHNYVVAETPTLAASAAVTNAAVFSFDAAAGTHKAVDGATTKTTPGGVDAWVKINVNGTILFMPAYTSKTA